MLEELTFVMSCEHPRTTYKIRKGEKFTLQIANYDHHLIDQIQVVLPSGYGCLITIDWQNERTEFVIEGTSREHSYTNSLSQFGLGNCPRHVKFHFAPNLKEQFVDNAFVSLQIVLDFICEMKEV